MEISFYNYIAVGSWNAELIWRPCIKVPQPNYIYTKQVRKLEIITKLMLNDHGNDLELVL